MAEVVVALISSGYWSPFPATEQEWHAFDATVGEALRLHGPAVASGFTPGGAMGALLAAGLGPMLGFTGAVMATGTASAGRTPAPPAPPPPTTPPPKKPPTKK